MIFQPKNSLQTTNIGLKSHNFGQKRDLKLRTNTISFGNFAGTVYAAEMQSIPLPMPEASRAIPTQKHHKRANVKTDPFGKTTFAIPLKLSQSITFARSMKMLPPSGD